MTGSVSQERRNLHATAKAIHRAVAFFELQNPQAYEQALAIAVCEPAKFNGDKQFLDAFAAKEAYETVIAETEGLKQSARALVRVAVESGLQTVGAELEEVIRLALQVSYAPISKAGSQALAVADLAIDAARSIDRRLE